MTALRILGVSTLLCLFIPHSPVAAAKASQPSAETSDQSATHWYSPSRYNPIKLFKRHSKSAEDQLNDDADLAIKLTSQLRSRGLLSQTADLRDVCSNFQDLALCLAALRVSHNLKIDFSCLKWDVSGIKPHPVSDSCAGPAGGKVMRLDRAIDLLKPDADSSKEANDALREARNEIKDAGS